MKKSDVPQVEDEFDLGTSKTAAEVKKRVQAIMTLKNYRRRAIYEKCGVEHALAIARQKLTEFSEEQNKSKENYDFMLNYAMERDADDLFRALSSNSKEDKRVLIDVLTARTKWQLNLISEAYERKHNSPLLKKIKENLRTSMGIFTGNNTDLGRLLLLVAMDQPERDAQLLTTYINDFDKIIEVSQSTIQNNAQCCSNNCFRPIDAFVCILAAVLYFAPR